MALLPTRDAITNSSTTNAAQKTNLGDQRDFLAELLGTDSSDKAAARVALGSASTTRELTNVTSASSVNLTTLGDAVANITGVSAITGFVLSTGQTADIVFAAATPLTYNATTNPIIGGASITAGAGDTAQLFYDGTTLRYLDYVRASGAPIAGGFSIASSAEVIARTNNTKAVSPLGLADISVLAPLQTPISGTSVDFLSIPSWAKQIVVMVSGISVSGTSDIIVQIGTSSGPETSGYVGGGSRHAPTGSPYTAFSSGFNLSAGSGVAAAALYGSITLDLMSPNVWAGGGQVANPSAGQSISLTGVKTLSGTLDRVRVTTLGGTDTFDLGTISIKYS